MIVLSLYVDSLECRLRNYANKLIWRSLSVRGRHFDGISAFDQFIFAPAGFLAPEGQNPEEAP